jgi:UDP-GlcNAc:undecaprenyl-phosphate GlcNAc-1-phosphate transferase
MGYAVVLIVAFATTMIMTPIVRRLSIRAGVVTPPGAEGGRHVHTRPTPSLGGIAMFCGFLAAMAVASQMRQFQEVFEESAARGVLLAAGVMLVVGMLDDIVDVSPPAKLAGMVLAGSLLARNGVTMYFFRVPFNLGHLDTVVLSPDLAPLVTTLWVVVMANAINLIDGLDGLAAGIVLIAGAAFYLFARELFFQGAIDGTNVAPLVAIIAIGICAGFLPWNWTPARIFMGDAGALFLGLLMAVPTITVGGRTAPTYGSSYFFYAGLLIPVIILGVPVADTTFSFFRRVLSGRGFSNADRKHLHHRLVEMGHGPRRTVFILWAFTALLSAAALLPIYTKHGYALLPLLAAALSLSLYVLFHPGVRSVRAVRGGRRARRTAGTPGPPDGAPIADNVVELRSRSS